MIGKILFRANDTAEYKKQRLDFEGEMAALNSLSLKSEFSPVRIENYFQGMSYL